MFKRIVLGLAALAIGASLAMAGDDHDHGAKHDHEHGAKHNGVVAHSGHHVLELVAAGNTLELYVTGEDGAPEDVKSAKASATVLVGGKTEQVTLAPSGENGLKGTGGFTAGKGTTVVITLTLPDHAPEQVRFKID
jgi:hypothetical protein